MSRALGLVLGMALLVGSMSGCGRSGVLVVPRTASSSVVQGFPSEEQVLQAIRTGATRKGWSIVKEEPGVVVATVTSGGHSATVRIAYDATGWAIFHQYSTPGLRYNPDHHGREVIHSRYNSWVRHLDRAIAKALSELGAQGGLATSGGGEAETGPK